RGSAAAPPSRAARAGAAAWRRGSRSSTSSEESFGGGDGGEQSGFRDDREAAEVVGSELGESLHEAEEALDLLLVEHVLGEHPEFVDVLLAGEGARAERVRIRDGDLVDDRRAVGQGDLDAAPEGLLGGV